MSKLKLEELIKNINKAVEELDFSATRKYIEENIDVLTGSKQLLKSNAREILKFLTEQKELGIEPLSRKELTIINAINAYAYKFDLRGIKLLLNENAKLFLREDSVAYLNNDALTILTGMGAISKPVLVSSK